MNDPGPNRATVAVVDAKVATVDAKVDGLAELIKAENAATRETLQPLRGLPEEVAALRADHNGLVQRVVDLEGHRTLASNWKALGVISVTCTVVGGVIGHITHL